MRLWPRKPNRLLARDLVTARFELRSLSLLAAARLVLPWRHDPEMRLGFTLTSRPRSALSWLRFGPRANNVTRFAFAIVPKGSTRPIGIHVVYFNAQRMAFNQVAIVDHAWRGRGVVEEVRVRLMNHFFARAPIDSFRGRVDSRNAGSIFVYRRLGFRLVATNLAERVDRVTGRSIDLMIFEMTRSAWEMHLLHDPAG